MVVCGTWRDSLQGADATKYLTGTQYLAPKVRQTALQGSQLGVAMQRSTALTTQQLPQGRGVPDAEERIVAAGREEAAVAAEGDGANVVEMALER